MVPEIDRFCNWLRRRSPQASTALHYRSDLQIFFRFVDKPCPEICPADVDRFVGWQVSLDHKATTVNRRLAAIRAFYDFLFDEGLDLPNPVLLRRHYLRKGRRLPRSLRDDDLARLFAAIDHPRDRAIFVLMVRCGLRVGEAARLRCSDCYLDEPYPRLLVNGKGNKDRAVYLSAQAVVALRAYLAVRPDVECEHLFLNRFDQPLSVAGIQFRLRTYGQRVGLDVSCHRLRHTYAQNLLEAGLPITTLQKLLGHSSVRTTEVYAHVSDALVRRDYDAATQRLAGWSNGRARPGQGLTIELAPRAASVPTEGPRCRASTKCVEVSR